jgi:predicted permease
LNSAFVVSQLALSLVLLIGAALFVQSFRNLLSVNPGFRADNVLMARLSLPETKYKEKTQTQSFYNQLRANVSSLPGVQAVELCSVVPFSGDGQGGPFTVEGFEQQQSKVAWLRSSTPGYFAAMRMPVLKGRAFDSSDSENSQPVAIVDEKLAGMYSPDGDLVGKRIRIGDGPWLTIVGVVPNVKNRRLDEEAWPYLYRPYSQWVRRETMLVVRSPSDPASIVGGIRQEVTKLDPELPLSDVQSVQQAMDRSLVTTRLTNTLLIGFAATALLLALTGIYGVMSLNVANRRNEFGIRLALGAQTSNVLKLILGQGLRLGLIGVALGVLAAIAFTRLLKGLLFGISASDPLTFAAIAALLVVVALLACWIPARRATKVDPLEALRYE